MGSMSLRHEGVSIQVEWPGGAMELNRFAKVVNAITDTYEASDRAVLKCREALS